MSHRVLAKLGLIWCPLCYSGHRGRGAYRGHLGWKEPRKPERVDACMPLARRQSAKPVAVDLSAVISESFVFEFPSCLEFCCLDRWPDATARSLGTIMLIFDQGCWKLWAHDRDGSVSCFVSSPTLEGALKALESNLSSGTGEWRSDKPGKGGKYPGRA